MSPPQDRQYLPRRLPVQLRLVGSDRTLSCSTCEIAHDSLFLQGAPAITHGRTVELTFMPSDGERISVLCVVEPHPGARLLLSFSKLTPDQYERLQDVIWPQWDGDNLIEGLILMCGRYYEETLADWIRLTTLLCLIKDRRCRFGRPAPDRPGQRRRWAAATPMPEQRLRLSHVGG